MGTVITLQTMWWELKRRTMSWNIGTDNSKVWTEHSYTLVSLYTPVYPVLIIVSRTNATTKATTIYYLPATHNTTTPQGHKNTVALMAAVAKIDWCLNHQFHSLPFMSGTERRFYDPTSSYATRQWPLSEKYIFIHQKTVMITPK